VFLNKALPIRLELNDASAVRPAISPVPSESVRLILDEDLGLPAGTADVGDWVDEILERCGLLAGAPMISWNHQGMAPAGPWAGQAGPAQPGGWADGSAQEPRGSRPSPA
jgi:hypothetical protein